MAPAARKKKRNGQHTQKARNTAQTYHCLLGRVAHLQRWRVRKELLLFNFDFFINFITNIIRAWHAIVQVFKRAVVAESIAIFAQNVLMKEMRIVQATYGFDKVAGMGTLAMNCEMSSICRVYKGFLSCDSSGQHDDSHNRVLYFLNAKPCGEMHEPRVAIQAVSFYSGHSPLIANLSSALVT